MASSRRTGTNENISTYGVLSTPRDYDVLGDWEAFTDNNLVAATTSEVLECYADLASYDDFANVGGATTNTSYFRIIRGAVGHKPEGIPGSGVHFESTGGTACLSIAENNFQVQDISISKHINSASICNAITVNGNPSGVNIIGVVARATNEGAGGGRAFHVISTNNDNRFINCLAYECKTWGFYVDGAGTKLIYNCTAVDNGTTGFHRQSGTLTTINCLGHGSGTSDFQGTMTSTNAASEDATASGTGARTSQTFTFVNSGSNNWHLARSDAGARGFGTDLTADGNFAFDDDIDGELISTWSIGFDSILHASSKVERMPASISKVHGALV
jgi:hypothetical protein